MVVFYWIMEKRTKHFTKTNFSNKDRNGPKTFYLTTANISIGIYCTNYFGVHLAITKTIASSQCGNPVSRRENGEYRWSSKWVPSLWKRSYWFPPKYALVSRLGDARFREIINIKEKFATQNWETRFVKQDSGI